MTQYFTSSDGLNLAYADSGSGPVVMCLAGLTRTHHDFDEMVAGLSGVRLIRPDYRGRGQSDYDPDFSNYAVQTEARDVLELMDHLHIDKAALIGTSRGGIISMVLSATSKARVTGVLLNDIGPVVDSAGLDLIYDYLGRKPKFKTLQEAATALPGLRNGVYNVPHHRWQTEAARMFKLGKDGLENRYDAKLRDAVMATSKTLPPDIWPFFEALNNAPLALLRGQNSDLLSEKTVAEMQARRPDMLFAEVKDRAHTPLLGEPESLDLIKAFIESLP